VLRALVFLYAGETELTPSGAIVAARAVSQLVYARSSGRAALQRRVNAGFLLVGLSTRCGAAG